MMRQHRAWLVAVGVFVCLCLAGCGDDLTLEQIEAIDDGTLRADVLAEGFDFPTQLFVGTEHWYIAQLSGAENDATGTVLRLDPNDLGGDAQLLLSGLDKPTGVAVFADELWVMERRRLTRGPLDGGDRVVVLDDMAFNGRSEGTLTVDGDRLLFNTSGSLRRLDDANVSPAESSGVLWSVDAAGQITAVASGFKHAYAQVRSADGTLWATEMTDGRFDEVAAQDELVAVTEGIDHGWPRCVENNRPVAEQGADEGTCSSVPASHALFAVGATPTSVVVAPWDEEVLLVSLWNRGEVVALSTTPQLVPESGDVVYDGVARPQHLAVDGNRVLLVDFDQGRILELSRG